MVFSNTFVTCINVINNFFGLTYGYLDYEFELNVNILLKLMIYNIFVDEHVYYVYFQI